MKSLRYVRVTPLVITLWFVAACSDEGGEPAKLPLTLKVTNATVESCEVYGAGNALIGRGSPQQIDYAATTEQYGVVRCGNLSGVFPIGAASVAVDGTTTAFVQTLGSTELPPGSLGILQMVSRLVDGAGTSTVQRLSSPVRFSSPERTFLGLWDGLGSWTNSLRGSGNLYAASALTDFVSAWSSFRSITTCNNSARALIAKQLLNLGQPVLLSPATAKIASTCSSAGVAGLSADAVSFDLGSLNASKVFSNLPTTGCLVVHPLSAVTSLNGLSDVPLQNDLSFANSIATESGIIESLCQAAASDKTYTVTEVLDAITSPSYLGQTFYKEDLEGNVTDNVSITTTDILRVLNVIANRAESDSFIDVSSAFRLATGYNPSGGWYSDVLATNSVGYDADCYPTTAGKTATNGQLANCDNPPRYGTYNTTKGTWTFDAAGTQILLLDSRGGHFTVAHPYDTSTSRFVRNSRFARVNLTPAQVFGGSPAYFDSDAGFYSVYTPNPTYTASLDPLATSDNTKSPTSVPYASAAWRAAYPYMSTRAKTFLFPYPEINGPQAILLAAATAVDQRMDALAALSAIKLLTSIAGIPYAVASEGASGTTYSAGHAILKDHQLDAATWDARVASFLDSGTARTKVNGANIIVSIRNARVQGTGFNSCKYKSGSSVSCTVGIDVTIGKLIKESPGQKEYAVSGTFSITSGTLGTFSFTPGTMILSTYNYGINTARFIQGDSGTCTRNGVSSPGCMSVDTIGFDFSSAISEVNKTRFGLGSFSLLY